MPNGTTPKTAAILLVGDEILRGQVQDENAHHMAKGLNALGIGLQRIEIVGDDVDDIAEATARLSRGHHLVFISGGVGPTHDDVTMDGVARAFKVSLFPNPELVKTLEGWHGTPLSPPLSRLTRIPENAKLVPLEGHFPSVRVENAYIFPGVPRLLKTKFDAVLSTLKPSTPPSITRAFVILENEFHIAEDLRALAHNLAPGVSVGSYPQRIAHKKHQVRITLTSRDPQALDSAEKLLLERLPSLQPEP